MTERVRVREGEAFTLHPGDFALGSTMETVCVPDDLVGHGDGSSYNDQSGLQVSRLRLDEAPDAAGSV